MAWRIPAIDDEETFAAQRAPLAAEQFRGVRFGPT
jgi:hypothetical protein